MQDEDDRFWHRLSEGALAAIWDNDPDDVYAALMARDSVLPESQFNS